MLIGCGTKSAPNHSNADSANTDKSLKSLLHITLENIDSFVDNSKIKNYCNGDTDSIMCRADDNKETKFASWDIEPTTNSDGDLTRFSILGECKLNKKFILIKAELGHDAPSIIFWNKKNAGMITVNPEDQFVYMSTDAHSLLAQQFDGNQQRKWDYWNNLDADTGRYYCEIKSGTLKFDTTIKFITTSYDVSELDILKLQVYNQIGCKPVSLIYDTALPHYMNKPIVDTSSGKAK